MKYLILFYMLILLRKQSEIEYRIQLNVKNV